MQWLFGMRDAQLCCEARQQRAREHRKFLFVRYTRDCVAIRFGMSSALLFYFAAVLEVLGVDDAAEVQGE